MPQGEPITVLHYVGYDEDRGGILAVVRALAAEGQFRCVLGVNVGFQPGRSGALECACFSPLAGETIGLATAWKARRVAREVQAWLDSGPRRMFHGHSRAGLLVALWLRASGERRAMATVHCYGRQRWFYRWAAGRLGVKLFWLSPAMKRYYGVGDTTWQQCIPGCLPAEVTNAAPRLPGVPHERPVRLGGVGAIVRWKRWHLVLEALAALPPDVRAALVFRHIGGPGDSEAQAYAEELRTLTERLGLSGNVEWRGEQASSAAFLREAVDWLVVASDHEPLSIAMLEALTAGVPVIAAASGGAVDVITPGREGEFFRDGDAADLARRFAALAAAGRPGRIVFEDQARFTARTVAAQYASVYARMEETP